MNNRIIVIDDEPDILDDYRRILGGEKRPRADALAKIAKDLGFDPPTKAIRGDEKYDVTICNSGEEGVRNVELSLKEGKPFAVIFCDMRMPNGIDGLETGKKIRKLDKMLEIVLVTAYSDHTRQIIVKELGDPEKLLYLKKPFDPDEIRQLALKLTKSWQMEQDLKKALSDAKAADKAKSAFLSMVTHELKTPLTGIIGSVQTMQLAFKTGQVENRYKFLGMIEISAYRLLDMINDILAYSRSNSYSETLKPVVFNLKEFMDSLFEEEISPLICDKDIIFTLNAEDVEMVADREKLRHIIINLTGNAIKFTPSGSILIKAYKNGLSNFDFTIADSGRGIPEEKIKNIYDEFFQVNRQSDEQQGSGLGLAIVKKFIRLQGGTIDVKSKEGRGTTFHFTIPEVSAFKGNVARVDI